jgi:hypothetical protein
MPVTILGGEDGSDVPALPRPRVIDDLLPKKHFLSRYKGLDAEFSFFRDEWEDIVNYIHPRRGRFLTGNKTPNRMNRIINNAASIASRTLAAGMMSGASSPARPWMKITTPDSDLNEYQPVKLWLETVQRRMYMVLAKSNFYQALHTSYGDLGDLGNACFVIDEDYNSVINCTIFSPGEYRWAIGPDGRVNTVYREFTMTVKALVDKYGKRVSQSVRNLYDAGNYDFSVNCLLAIEPNFQQIKGIPGPRGMPFVQVIMETAGDADLLLETRGRHEWPAPSPRWDVMSGDIYGNGCGLDARGDAMALQELERQKGRGIAKMMTPPTQGSLQSKNAMPSHIPGGHTLTQSGQRGGATIGPLYEIRPESITVAGNEILQHEKRCQTAYYADLFLMLAQSDRREITAREVEERHEEKLLALGPVIERLHTEGLNVSVDRTFAIMYRAELFPPAPQELKGMELQTEYISILAQAQRAVAVGSIERVAGFVGDLSAVYPSAKNKFDANQAIDQYAQNVGVPAQIIRSDDDAQKISDQEAQAAQAAQAAAAAPGVAQSAQVLADTTVTPESLLGRIVGA